MGWRDRGKDASGGRTARFGLEDLARRLAMPADALRRFTPAYRTFAIPKRGGGRRTIAAPDEATKALQRRILRRVLGGLRAHPCATGFERRHSIVTNALPHVGKPVVLRMDLEDFFGSTPAKKVEAWFRSIGWDKKTASLLTQLVAHRRSLPQGAPTSPRLSNLVNRGLDARLEGLALRYGASYTRYADDITFSFGVDRPGQAGAVIWAAKRILEDEGYRLHVRKKLRIRRARQQQLVTGIVVNEKPNLPRRTRRLLRAVAHRRRTGGRPTMTAAAQAGWEALLAMVEKQRAP
ncbi:MAG: RNA-directed DNA polymerase [Planctomycetes bacterium]|nr:RNA-directed DNA polymerase [Planctomycetota bacterium]